MIGKLHMIVLSRLVAVSIALLAFTDPAVAQSRLPAEAMRLTKRTAQTEIGAHQRRTIGLAGGLLEGAPIHFATEMARVVNDSSHARVLPIGTSMGISTIYLAAALRDNGGGHLIGSELEPAMVARARANLDAASLSDLVDIREGDALDTLKEVGGDVDLLLIDGAFSLYLPVLKLVEPRLKPGAVVLGENAFEPEDLDYLRNPANG
jgi:protein-L-isoaspartate O-methyltransferase